MSEMTSRQRVTLALDHIEPDRVPFDCTFTLAAYQRLSRHLGQAPDPLVTPGSPSLSVTPPENFLRELGVDLYYIGLGDPSGRPAFEVGMPVYIDEWGIGYRRIETTTGVDYVVVSPPLAQARLQDLDDYPWPDPDDPALTTGLAEKARRLAQSTEFALVGKFNTALFEHASLLRGMERLYLDLVEDPEFVGALLDKLTDLAIRQIGHGLKACGPYLQILRLAGDDLGGQQGPLISPRMFRRLVKPHFARLYREAKRLFLDYNPAGKLMAHTDGDVYPLINDYIEMGLDVLNPVQPFVAEMDHARLKREFGHQLSFHGGIDIQHTLPFGTQDEVRLQVRHALTCLAPGGGCILAPTHYLLPDVPPENILTLRDTMLESGKYPLRMEGYSDNQINRRNTEMNHQEGENT
jgi:uroporphyrinogen decarboxylase